MKLVFGGYFQRLAFVFVFVQSETVVNPNEDILPHFTRLNTREFFLENFVSLVQGFFAVILNAEKAERTKLNSSIILPKDS